MRLATERGGVVRGQVAELVTMVVVGEPDRTARIAAKVDILVVVAVVVAIGDHRTGRDHPKKERERRTTEHGGSGTKAPHQKKLAFPPASDGHFPLGRTLGESPAVISD